ncbi:hypothetical protein [Chelativorans sp. AA-79]|uniref:hypothetical protein n=1 Tax=Chelativorans sp. AA-79 TaxID=3028735 RepID=UPI0023FA1EB7|nr:hypothetical protein [Chelativorans sp. AA-79]WEX10264.1 hypothetical protein PVE73_04710 [Chelativorans sp. AA-79]
MLGLGTWIKLGAALAVLAALAVSHGAAYRAGKSAVLGKLASDRITIMKDGRRIDEEVLGADDGALCALLGGCLPDEGGH